LWFVPGFLDIPLQSHQVRSLVHAHFYTLDSAAKAKMTSQDTLLISTLLYQNMVSVHEPEPVNSQANRTNRLSLGTWR
jgi:hypothetical protein